MDWFARRRSPADPDAGVTLVEIIVAMTMAGIVLVALLGASIAAAKATVNARVNQQAGDLLTKSIEDMRSLDYAALSLRTSDLTADPEITGTPLAWQVPNGAATTPEAIVSDATGAVYPHITTVTANANNGSYTVKRYVTQVAGNSAVKRVTVKVEWVDQSGNHTRTSSTIVADTRRGLPLPSFVVSNGGGGVTSVERGGTAVLPFFVRNLGAPDSFSLTVLEGTTVQVGWSFYRDTNCLGSLDSAYTPLAENAGVVVTGQLFPDAIACFLAVEDIDRPAGTYGFAISATSTVQPEAGGNTATGVPVGVTVSGGAITPTPTPSPSDTPTGTPTPTPAPTETDVVVAPSPIPTPSPAGYSLHQFMLRNVPLGNTATIPLTVGGAQNPMNRDSGTVQYGDHQYSTNVAAQTGRNIQPGGSVTQVGSASVAEWRWLPAQTQTRVNGPVQVRFSYLCASGIGDERVTFGIGQWDQSKSQYTAWTSVQSDVLTCNDTWQSSTLTTGAFSECLMANNGCGSGKSSSTLAIRLAVSQGSQLWINYDSNNAPSALFAWTDK